MLIKLYNTKLQRLIDITQQLRADVAPQKRLSYSPNNLGYSALMAFQLQEQELRHTLHTKVSCHTGPAWQHNDNHAEDTWQSHAGPHLVRRENAIFQQFDSILSKSC